MMNGTGKVRGRQLLFYKDMETDIGHLRIKSLPFTVIILHVI